MANPVKSYNNPFYLEDKSNDRKRQITNEPLDIVVQKNTYQIGNDKFG